MEGWYNKMSNIKDVNDRLKSENVELKKEVKRLKEEATSLDKEWYRFHMERKRELEKFLTPKWEDEISTLERDNALDTL